MDWPLCTQGPFEGAGRGEEFRSEGDFRRDGLRHSVNTVQWGGGRILPAALGPRGPRGRTDIDDRPSQQTGPGEKPCTQSGMHQVAVPSTGESTEILRAASPPCTW